MKKLKLNIIGENQIKTKDERRTPAETFKNDGFLQRDLYLEPALPGNQTQNRRARELKFLSVKKGEPWLSPALAALKCCVHTGVSRLIG